MKVGQVHRGADLEKGIDTAADMLRRAGNAVALTGAGVSTESGIPDFRSKGGLWSRYDPMEYGTLGAFRRDSAKVWTMLAELLEVVDARPNRGHLAMARLESMGRLAGIITQNIDGLHQAAGSRKVVEFHGSMSSFSCPHCGARHGVDQVRIRRLPPSCICGGILKPDIVFFDEAIPQEAVVMTEALLRTADLLIVAGTSCQVAPASYIPMQARQQGARVIEINLEPAPGLAADLALQGSFGAIMTGIVEALEQGR